MNILLTSAGRRTYMVKYFKNALDGSGKVFASNSVLTNTLLQADEYVLTPYIYDNKYISFLVDYCKKKNTVMNLTNIFQHKINYYWLILLNNPNDIFSCTLDVQIN